MIQKWDYDSGEYKPYTPPDSRVSLYCQNMNEVISCACCGKRIRFGESYTSQEIHSQGGFGYSVCPECHRLEITRLAEFLDKEDDG